MSTGIMRTFRPLAATQNTSVTATNQQVTLNRTTGTQSIRMCNLGTETVYIEFGGVATASASLPLPAGQTEVFTVGSDITYYGVIAGTTGSTLYSTVGEGL